MMKKIRYEYYNKWVTTGDNINVRSHDQEESELKRTINQFRATCFFKYPLKTSENQGFSDVFRGYQKRSGAWNGLIKEFTE